MENVEDNLQNDGTILCDWFKMNGMAPNLTKFVAFTMGFSSNIRALTVSLDDVLIEGVPSVNNL